MLVVLAALLFPSWMHASDFDLSDYTLVKSMDFSGFTAETQLTQGETATEKVWDNGNGQNQTMYQVTDEAYAGYMIFQSFTSKGFIISANGGLYSKGAQRCAAVTGLTKGQLVVFTTTQDADNVMSFYKTHAKGDNLPDGNYNLTKATDGNGYYVVMTDDGYLGFNGLNGKQAIAKIEIYQPKEGTNLASYTVKYVDENGTELQEAMTYTSAIGMQCNVYPADRPTQLPIGDATYVLNSSDAAEKTVAADGSTVVTLTYKAAAPVPYAVVEKAGDIVFRTTKGEAVTGTAIKVPYRFYNAANGQLYKKAQTNKEFNYSFTLTQENQVENLEYTAQGEPNTVVFIAEGEDIPGLTPCNSSNTAIRSSNSASAYPAEDTKIVTLGPGTYQLHALIYDASKNPDSHWTFRAGDTQIADLHCTVVNIQELQSQDFTLTEPTDIIMEAAGNSNMGLDAIWITGDGKAYEAPADVTSQYLKNADFAASTALDAEAIYGYGKDGSPYGLTDVEEWTKVVVREDPNESANYPASGMGAGVVAYGSATILKGNSKAAPEAGPNGEAGNALAFFGVWGCGGYYAQDVKLPAGEYTITVPIFSQSGTNGTTSYTGFFVNGSDKSYTVATNPEPGAWAIQTVKFVLTAETAGQIRLGYVSEGSGSGANPMIFIDGIRLQYSEVDAATIAKVDLESEIATAEALISKFENGKAELESAITTAKTVLATATKADELSEAIDALKTAELTFKAANKPVPEGTYFVKSASKEGSYYMAAGHSWGTQAIVNNDGLDLTLLYDIPSGKYTIDTQVFNGTSKHFLGSNLYMDSDPYGWTIEATANNTFTIGDGEKYISIDAEDNLVLSETPAEWTLLTIDTFVKALEEASAENPVDATFLVKGANFNRNDGRNSTWETWSQNAEENTNFNISGGNNLNNNAESYHAKFYLTQTIEGVPNGVYEMTAQGYYRQDGDDTENLPYFFINDAKVTFPEKTGAENSMSDASVSFTDGLYTIEPVKVVVTDGKITLGAKNDENLNLWVIWDNFRLTYYGESTTDPNLLDLAINHERATGLGYTPTEAEVDFTEAKSWLGVDAITTDMLRIENPDGELISDYAPFDGWFNGDGIAEKWGSTTKVCVKFFEAIPDGKFTFYDMNGADVDGNTYSVRWRLVNGEKSVRYTINVTFKKPAADEQEIVDKGIMASVTYELADPDYVEQKVTLTDEQVAAICAELGIADLSEATAYGYNPTTKELVKNFAGYDGWRDANGDFHNWNSDGTQAPACVKYTDGKEYLCYNRTGMEAQTIKTYWAISNGTKAVLVEIDFIYNDESTGIAEMHRITPDNGTRYNLNGKRVDSSYKGIVIVNGKKTLQK